MKVTRLPVDPGPAGWNEILPAADAAQELDERTTADDKEIGGGVLVQLLRRVGRGPDLAPPGGAVLDTQTGDFHRRLNCAVRLPSML